MGKSELGPGMQDCSSVVWEIEQDQNVTLSVLLELDGSVGGYGWYVHVVAVPKTPRALGAEPGCSASLRWPHREHRTFEGCLLQLVNTVDYLLTMEKAKQEAVKPT